METNFNDEMHILNNDLDKLSHKYSDQVSRVAQLILEAQKAPFWKEYFIPKIDRLIAEYDALHQNAKDPWERYGLTEAYKVLCTFKMEILDEVNEARQIIQGHPGADA